MAQGDALRRSFRPDDRPPETPYDKSLIGGQLDAFAERHGIKSLRDRLRIGLNEVAILAYDKTNAQVKEMVSSMVEEPEEAARVYQDLVDISVGIQQAGPWGFAGELAEPRTPEMKAWFMLAAAETMGYEREMDLNDTEFVNDIKRIEGHLQEAVQDNDAFFAKAQEHLLKNSEKAIRFAPDDREKKVPIGEGFASFLPMALQGYEAGVVQDAEGWVYVGARGEISDPLMESIGLKKRVGPDDRDPNRTVTYFENDQGQKVVKKIHPGLLVVLSRSFDLATSVVRALNEEKEVVDVAENALGHTRVLQTSEKERAEEQDRYAAFAKEVLLGRPESDEVPEAEPTTTALTRPREEFYGRMLYVRSNYVYLDALGALRQKRKEQGKEVTEHDKLILFKKIEAKMRQKVEELRHVNSVVERELENLPQEVREVIDMAGGAGDLGLAVTNELLSRGREVDHVEIVDPQEGVAEFMDTIIDHLPFRDRLEEIAEHNTGYLQDAEIKPESLVVAKHACGTLTDSIIEQWRGSDSKMLVAMTCCQDKAKDEPARYGFSQAEWHKLCVESAMTNTEVPEAPGKARDKALRRLERGNRAMKKLDMARVEYLRRHGFQARLDVTDKFPKGDTIIARRLPENFMKKLGELQELEKNDPLRFDALMMRLDVLAAGGEPKDLDPAEFGEDWGREDFAELTRRFIEPAFEEFMPVNADEKKESAPDAGQENKDAKKKEKALLKAVFADLKGRIDLYLKNRAEQAGKTIEAKQFGPIAGAISNRIKRMSEADPAAIREAVDAMMEEMGY
ncbi:hypothetical protein AMJ57_02310 [Parcubacteria bacterium SG8_24]|nr:MAG: hypothetical protein AMJ57_02310 [Parcubacteria bacterium SG8_24]